NRWTWRFEAHLWDKICKKEGQCRKGRQGGYDKEENAGRAYDLAALKYWGPTTVTNFPVESYEKELDEMKNMSTQDYVNLIRRSSTGFSRGASTFRGVTRLMIFTELPETQEEAAEAYDIASIKYRGENEVTNFDISRYDVNSIMEDVQPIGKQRPRKFPAEKT
ncbi:hypothetical protein KI387_004820, partial [Taxus chinensis]